MNIERLNHLLTIMNGVRLNQRPFDLRSWGEAHACGTSACACGYAALDPEFQREGFVLRPWTGGEAILTTERFNEFLLEDGGDVIPTFGSLRQFDAADAFFGLKARSEDGEESPTSVILFSQHVTRNNDAADVIERIERLLAVGEEQFCKEYNAEEGMWA